MKKKSISRTAKRIRNTELIVQRAVTPNPLPKAIRSLDKDNRDIQLIAGSGKEEIHPQRIRELRKENLRARNDAVRKLVRHG